MAEAEVSVKIVADIEDMKKSLAEMAAKMGDVEKVGGVSLDNMFGKASVLSVGFNAVTQAVGFLSEKLRAVTVDLAMVGERAAQVEAGFVRLADNAGLAGESLKQAIVDAAQGTIETTELLRRSSELVVAFGRDAQRIPELIEMSRKMARTFGMDAAEAFDSLSGAIRGGNDRALKQLGIIVDLDKAKRDYAKSIGVTVNELTREGEATARLNAVLDIAGKKFADVSTNTKTLAESFAFFKNKLSDVVEESGKVVTNTGFLQAIFNRLGIELEKTAEHIKKVFGSESQKEVEALNFRIQSLTRQLEVARKIGLGDSDAAKNIAAKIEEANRQMERLIQNQQRFNSVAGQKTETKSATTEPDAAKFDSEKRKQNERAALDEINRLRLQQAQNDIKLAQDQASLDMAQHDRRLAMEQELELKKQEIRNRENLGVAAKNQLIEEQETLHQQNMMMLRQQEEAEYMAMLERKLYASQSIDDQIAVSGELQARRTQQAWQRAGGLGGAAMQSFSNRTMAAFAAVGAGTMTMAEAMKSAFFGMLGDVAMAQGKTMFLTNLAPPLGPNPAGMAAGLGLIALGGLLGSLGGGKSAMGAGGVGGGGGAGFGGPEGGFGGPGIADAAERRKEVTINIEGNYYDNEQTRMAIVQAVRDAGDSSDFNIQRGNRRR